MSAAKKSACARRAQTSSRSPAAGPGFFLSCRPGAMTSLRRWRVNRLLPRLSCRTRARGESFCGSPERFERARTGNPGSSLFGKIDHDFQGMGVGGAREGIVSLQDMVEVEAMADQLARRDFTRFKGLHQDVS